MLNSDPVDVAGLPSLDEESGAVSTRALESEGAGQESHLGDSVKACTWLFRVEIRIVDRQNFQPTYFSHVLKTRDTVLKATLSKAKILSYSCLGLDESSGVAKFEGFIHSSWESAMRLGTLKRWMLHPDIVGSVLWVPVLKHRRYVDHPAIKSFLEDTVPASIAADGLRLRVDYLQPSETPPKKGGRPVKRGPATSATGVVAADASDAVAEAAGGGVAPATVAPVPACHRRRRLPHRRRRHLLHRRRRHLPHRCGSRRRRRRRRRRLQGSCIRCCGSLLCAGVATLHSAGRLLKTPDST